LSSEYIEPSDLQGELTTWLARHLVAERGRGRLAIFTLPAPVAPLETFLGVTDRNYGVVWHPPDGSAWAASGAAEVIPLRGGKAGLDQLRAAASRLFDEGVHYNCPGATPVIPRLFGGIAFADHGNDVAPWTEFSDGCFNLPRWTYMRTEARATLSLAVRVTGGYDGLIAEDAILAEYETISEALLAHDCMSTQTAHFRELGPVDEERISQTSLETWRAHVEAIRRGIAAQQFIKVVAARACVVELPEVIDDTTMLARLGADFRDTTRFAFRRAHSTLLGASPEVLFSKKGRLLETEALAGTIRSLGSEYPRASRQSISLLNSSKDLGEHALVVNGLIEELSPLVESIDVPTTPNTRKVRNIIHLNTPITGQLRPGVDAVDLLRVLHPTAAVGGTPRGAALEFIRRHEAGARGWYTGAVGWIDAQGDACFNVAIRAGLLELGRRVHIYTGAGIVADSDADDEYAETALKQQPMLRALGIL
jgi:isochorismate synthase